MKDTQSLPLRGWVKCPRSILAHPMSQKPRLLSLWITLTLLAPIEGGEMKITLTRLAKQTGLGRNNLTTDLHTLWRMGLVTSFEMHCDGVVVTMPSPCPSTSASPRANSAYPRANSASHALTAPSHSSYIYKEKEEYNNKYINYSSSLLG